MLSVTLANASFGRIGGLALDLRGQPTWFNLTRIDLRSESEHTIRGKHYPLEIQLVHRPAHFYPQSDGPESVTISIFVDCPNPPKAPQVWPGLLQEKTRPRKLRGTAKSALLQQSPFDVASLADSETLGDARQAASLSESDAVMPDPAGNEAEDEIDDDPMHQRMNNEINFVHTLVEGEESISASPAAAPAASPAGAPGSVEEVYTPPGPFQQDFNPLLQFLVAQEPPDLDNWVSTEIGPDTPLRLGALLSGGTYFYYWGSSTLPPCAERDMWLIKREVIKASTEQVKAIYSTLHLMSGGSGNYRTGMPVNQRAVEVLAGKEGIPRKLQPTSSPSDTGKPTGKEQKYIDVAKDAITIAKAAADYAKDIDWRIQAGSTAHLKAMEAPVATTPAPTTSAFIPKPPMDQIWATKIMSGLVKEGIKNAMKANIEELVPATASLATSYLRQRLLKKAGFGPPPIGAKVLSPTPIPGVPTFFPPGEYEQPSNQDMDAMKNYLARNNCSAATNFSGCANVSGVSGADAKAMAEYMAANSEDDEEEEEEQMTPEQVAQSLPAGVNPVPADWPDEDSWPNGLPPANVPPYTSAWPDPAGTRPAGMSDYQWERYQYNWNIYRSSYTPYVSSYRGYSINRRRRMSSSSRRRSYSYSSSSRRRSSYSSSYSSRRRSSSSYSSGRRRSSSYSSGRRRSYSYR